MRDGSINMPNPIGFDPNLEYKVFDNGRFPAHDSDGVMEDKRTPPRETAPYLSSTEGICPDNEYRVLDRKE